MKQISVLDCTLRDGGYVNDFNFGRSVIKAMIGGLAEASIDIIECGFLKSGCNDPDRSLFSSIETVRPYITEKAKNTMYVAMIQYGAIGIGEISECDGTAIDGIRLSFHENEIDMAFEMGIKLKNKGYKVFMQPVGTTSYEDSALIGLIKRINLLKPYAFYIVDTLGRMYKNDLLHMFYLVEHNLDKRIALGFHSHNNLQMSFANAQELLQTNTNRNLIVDSSVLGMGRGAGNLNTELIVQYLNVNRGMKYDVLKIMDLMDQFIKPLRKKHKWGYDAAYFLAAANGCHPNYASYLLNKQTIHIRDIGAILNGLDDTKRNLFDKDYIESAYMKYMDHNIDDSGVRADLSRIIGKSKVLLLASGKSIEAEKNRIKDMIKNNEYIVMSINFQPLDIPIDFVFISNMKRFEKIKEKNNNVRTIVTSNVDNSDDRYMIVNYASYLSDDSAIADNAGMMCINLLIRIGVKRFVLAGFDGFSENVRDNFYEESLYLDVDQERLIKMNMAISNRVKQLKKRVEINFLAASTYDK